ncbi:MAG: hypothetical protein JW994_02230, partial [Candidatus Omnitrophica bacterium]|nr:hypothetical protein [Candidatus Omnitrophota bacterium]
LKDTVGKIANAYLKHVKKPYKTVDETGRVPRIDYRLRYTTLSKERRKVSAEIKRLQKRINDIGFELSRLQKESPNQNEIKQKIAQLDAALIPLKNELENLRITYTDNWPSVVKLKAKITILEDERLKLSDMLPVVKEREKAAESISYKIDKDKAGIMKLEDRIKFIDRRVDETKKRENGLEEDESLLKKEELINYIITPPTEKVLPELGIRLSIASAVGLILWVILGYLLKNAYIILVTIDRLFNRKR